MASLPQPDRNTLFNLLRENNGKLSNAAARRLLGEATGKDISLNDYEIFKEQLLSEGLIRKATGRGGSIQILIEDADTTQGPIADEEGESCGDDDRLERIYTAINYVPGVRVRINRTALTLLFGDDEDKLFCGWNDRLPSYYIQYRIEAGKTDYSEQAEGIFREVSADMPEASIKRNSNSATLLLGVSVPKVVQVVRRLKASLDQTNIGGASEPLETDYYEEIGSLIKLAVDNGLRWPFRNWRKTLGFDEVDDLILIGNSPDGMRDKYREHVVPASLLKDEAIKLAEEGAPAEVIADFLRHHLFIVWISFKEAEMLNSGTDNGGCSLKTTMPKGWVFGCDPLERLQDAGIPIQFNRPIEIKKWIPWRKREESREGSFRNIFKKALGIN